MNTKLYFTALLIATQNMASVYLLESDFPINGWWRSVSQIHWHHQHENMFTLPSLSLYKACDPNPELKAAVCLELTDEQINWFCFVQMKASWILRAQINETPQILWQMSYGPLFRDAEQHMGMSCKDTSVLLSKHFCSAWDYFSSRHFLVMVGRLVKPRETERNYLSSI